jgi:hypothetical protein
MTTSRKTSRATRVKKLKVKKETIKDLDVKRGSINGGSGILCQTQRPKLDTTGDSRVRATC